MYTLVVNLMFVAFSKSCKKKLRIMFLMKNQWETSLGVLYSDINCSVFRVMQKATWVFHVSGHTWHLKGYNLEELFGTQGSAKPHSKFWDCILILIWQIFRNIPSLLLQFSADRDLWFCRQTTPQEMTLTYQEAAPYRFHGKWEKFLSPWQKHRRTAWCLAEKLHHIFPQVSLEKNPDN